MYTDGSVLTPIAVQIATFGGGRIALTRYMASPFPRLDDLKVHGSTAINRANGRIYWGAYDFNAENPAWYNPLGQLREYLNNQAIIEHGEGTPFQIRYNYDY